MPQKTHRKVNNPQISARYLADYMAASEQAARTIVRKCKYQAIARVVQHDEAKLAASTFISGGGTDMDGLLAKAQKLRDRITEDDFERSVWDHNADYIERLAKVFPGLKLPKAELMPPGNCPAINVNGVKVTAEVHFRLRRLTKTNKVRIGAGMFRYAKGTPLPTGVAEWQSAFLFGYLHLIPIEENAEPELKLCLTVDAQAGVWHPAPTDSISRFKNMQAACATIAERWPNIPPPPNAVF